MPSSSGESLRNDPVWQEALDWYLRVRSAPDDARLRAARDAWLRLSEAHARAYARAEKVWRLTGEVPAAAPARAIRRRSIRRPLLVSAALALAACLLLAILPALSLRLQADHLTATAETREIALADGSSVHLDAESAIAVAYTGGERGVSLLAGQAFFQVLPGDRRPFRVSAGGVAVTVTGTAFDVRADRQLISVAVQSGSVRVGVGSKETALIPGDRLTVRRSDGQVVKDRLPPGQIASWRGGRLVVDGATVAEVVEELGRYHRGLIVLRDEDLAGRRVTGVFDLHDTPAALRAVLQPHAGQISELTPYLLLVSARR